MSREYKDQEADRELVDFMISSFEFDSCPDEFDAFCKKLISTPPAERNPIAFKFFQSKNLYPKIKPNTMKSSARALKLKNSGNERFGRGDFVGALNLYTMSAATAPVGSPELAIAFANRSAALYKLDRFEACLVDINRALNEDYPEASKQKLYERKKKCSMLINRRDSKLGKSFQKLSLSDKVKLRKDAGDNGKKYQVDEDALDLNYAEKFPVPQSTLKNENISNATDKIKIDINSSFGLHIVADKDIEIGEVIGIEPPYASILKLEYQYSHCAHCFVRCEALMPCPGCSAVMYCSRRCRDDAFALSHRIECQILSLLGNFSLANTVWLAIRVLMVMTRQGEDLEKLMKHARFKNPMEKACNAVPKKVDSQDPIHLLDMKENIQFINRWDLANMELILSEAALSVPLIRAAAYVYRNMFVVNLLRNTSFFGTSAVGKTQKKNPKQTEKEEYTGLLLLKLVSCITHYAFEISEIHQEEDFFATFNFGRNVFVGRGLYMFHSFFNHSCFENVHRHFHKDTIVSRAVRPIKAGEQLFMNYGPSFIKESQADREYFLRKNFEFECSCEACKYDWKSLSEMSSHLEFLPDANISLKKVDWYTLKLHEKLSDSPVIEYSPELFNFLKEYLKIFYDNFVTPSSELIHGYLALRTVLQSLGNSYVYTRDRVLMSL